MTPDGKTFDPETVTDKQLVQYEQAIDRGLTEADAMRLTEHEYKGSVSMTLIVASSELARSVRAYSETVMPFFAAFRLSVLFSRSDNLMRTAVSLFATFITPLLYFLKIS